MNNDSLTTDEVNEFRFSRWSNSWYVRPLLITGDLLVIVMLMLLIIKAAQWVKPEETNRALMNLSEYGLFSWTKVLVPPAYAQANTEAALGTTGAYETIMRACALEGCPDARLLYAIWRTETSVQDCRPYQNMPTPNKCVSPAGARGPFQFLDGTWVKYSDPTWDKWSLLDSARAATRMTKDLKLYDQVSKESFAKRFSGGDGGQCWNCGFDGYQQGLRVWEIWKNFLLLRKPAEGLVISQAFNSPYPDTTTTRSLGISGLKHSNGVDFAKVENGKAIPFEVKNAIDGKVLDVVETPQFGLIVKLQSIERPDVIIEYWHLGMVSVSKGDTIKVGEKIGTTSGAGSSSTGAHLHLRLLIGGRDEDPARYFSP